MEKLQDEDTLAYQTGFSDAFDYGYEKRNKYKRDKEKHLYKMGYDAGIKEYEICPKHEE